MKPLSTTMMLSDKVGFVGARELEPPARGGSESIIVVNVTDDRREHEHEHVRDDVEEGDDVELTALFVGRELLGCGQAADPAPLRRAELLGLRHRWAPSPISSRRDGFGS